MTPSPPPATMETAETGEEVGTEEEVEEVLVEEAAGGEGQRVAGEGGEEPRERSWRRRRNRPRSPPRRLNPTPTLALTLTLTLTLTKP